ncbi:MAG: hypothetical protein IJ193_04930 [Bacilli bacterium]|nr:hypothetical protein [Bacilli bacterium]
MKKLEDGIVFSNDIERILKGKNAIDYSYEENGLVLPESSFIKRLREDFKKDTSRIFQGKSIIVEEEEMLKAMVDAIRDVYGRVPHRIVG